MSADTTVDGFKAPQLKIITMDKNKIYSSQ